MKKLLTVLVILLSPFAVGARATFAGQGVEVSAGSCADGKCIACPYGGSTEPSAHDCQMSGGYVVGTPNCNDGGCGGSPSCVCCDWYRRQQK